MGFGCKGGIAFVGNEDVRDDDGSVYLLTSLRAWGVPSKFCDKNGEISMRSWTFPQGRVHRETEVDDANERTENGRGGS